MSGKLIRKRITVCILALVLTCTNCFSGVIFAANDSVKNNDTKETIQDKKDKKNKSDARTDIIVKYKDDTKKDATIKNAKSKSKASKLGQKNYYKKYKIGVYEINISDDMDAVIEELAKDPNVEYAQPNYQLSIESIPTDTKWNYQWALNNVGQAVDGNAGRLGVDINAIKAWSWYETMESSDVVVGVLDTGIDTKHTDLSANIFTNTKEVKGNGIDDDGNGYIDDINGWDFSNDDYSVYDGTTTDTHGTYIAGIIAAAVNNGGIAGVARNVKVLPLKFINGTSGYTSDAIEAIEYARNIGVTIINCSFGGTDNNLALKDAMQDSGILFICSAGNGGNDTATKNIYPAAFDINNVLSVTAIDSNGVLPPFANYGANVDIAAPGTSILSTKPENGYDYFSGTSASAAIVSGVAALVKSCLPNESTQGIKNRIINNATPCASLSGKVVSGGRVDAYGALKGIVQPTDSYYGKGNSTDALPTNGEGEADTWYTMDELASNVERFHYGEGGVNPASGNYSVNCTDMSITAPGFTVNISRSYNSRNQRQTLLGRGWTFGFEGMVTNKGDYVEVSLPNGSAHTFRVTTEGYVGDGTRASLKKNADGSYTLTTQDQYKYGFDPSTYKMTYMEDKNGNQITLAYTAGSLTKITDTVGRVYTLTYNTKALLSSVIDPAGRVVTYEYNTSNLLNKVTDPQGGSLTYEYDSSGYLTKLIDQNLHTFQQLVYSHDYGDTQNKVIQSTDAAGETWNYSYDVNNRNTTITNSKNKKWTYWFVASMYTTQVQDPEGKSNFTEYYFIDNTTYYGDVRTSKDRNGNLTEYGVDPTTGNVTKVTKPDNGFKTYVYDQWNNVIEEVNESGSRTFFIYDTGGKNLLKKAQPLNGTSNYVEGNTIDFAVNTYTYYTKSEAKVHFNCDVAGLMKSVTDPEGKVTTYKYNIYGDITSIDEAGKVTVYTYDIIGRKLDETTPEKNKTQYTYNKNSQVIKVTNPDGGMKRTVYDSAGYTSLEVNPNLYDVTKENTTTGAYTGTIGTSYEWYDNGYQKAVKDAAGNRTVYTWDTFGNKQSETKPNGSIYRYEYDSLNRLTKTYFKDNSTVAEVLLSEISYGILPSGNTQTTTTLYADSDHKSTTVTVKDYAGREVEVQYADYSRATTTYNTDGTIQQKTAPNGATTYYSYDKLGNMTGKWIPISIADGTTMYSWTGYTYDKEGNVTSEKTGKPLVTLYATTEDSYTKYYTYQNGLKTQETDSEDRKTMYSYDGDKRVSSVTQYVSPTQTQVTEYLYNYLGKPIKVTTKVRSGDLVEFSYDNNGITDITNTFEYDKDGNLIKSTDAAGTVTSYTYDKLDRALTTTKQLKNSPGGVVTDVLTSRTYTWDGQIASETDAKGNVTRYDYDAQGNQTEITDALLNVTRKMYDRIGRNTAIVSPKNYKAGTSISDMERTEYEYDGLARVIRQVEVYKKMVLAPDYQWTPSWVNITTKGYRYDPLGNVTSVTDALGNTTESVYNLAGLPEYVTDAETKTQGLPYTVRYTYNGLGQKIKEAYQGTEYAYTYNGAGNLLQTLANGFIKSSATYDYLGRALSSTDGLGNTTEMTWNALGKVSQITTPGDASIASNRTIHQYDRLGNLLYTKDVMGKIITYTYDSFGRMLSQTTGDGTVGQKITVSTTYDLNGNVVNQIDGRINSTSYEYDVLNRVSKMTNARQQVTTYSYDANGNQTEQKDYLGNFTIKVYDGINRLVEVRDAYNNIVQQLIYNDANAQTDSYDALHNRTQYLYDGNLRQIGTIDAETNKSSITYDARGNVSTRTDGKGNPTTYKYDRENHLTSVTDALGNNTFYTYDLAGNLSSQTDGNSNTTTYLYNAANLKKAKIDHAGSKDPTKTESYTYYANGLMATKTDRNSVTTVYSYDIFGKLLSENAGGEIQSYTYDANGNLITMTDSTGITNREYDALNRNTSKTVPGTLKSIYEYDIAAQEAGGYCERTTDPKGNVTLKTYDKVGRLSKVTVGTKTTTYTYLKNGSRASVTYPDGTKETYSYNKNNQVTSLINAKANGTVISSYSYTYDAAGNQLTKTEAKGTTNYNYDSLNRLSSVTEPVGKVTSYTYDGAGNRKTEKVQTGSTTADTVYYYNNQNRLVSSISTTGSNLKYIYDNNGNLVSKVSGFLEVSDPAETGELPEFSLIIKTSNTNGTGAKELTRYKYDKYNRMIMTESENTTSTYRYNAQGYRIEKLINGLTTKYLYEGDKVVLETDGSNVQKAFMAYGSNLLYRDVKADGATAAQSYYYMYNAHGDVTALINAEGAIAATYDYDAFGNIISETGSANNYIKYAGYQWDKESGLYYLNARYYDSVTARFITEDSYRGQANDPLSLNLYTYCANNPIMYADPTGHKKANITVGDIKVGNGKVNKGTYTGNLTDVVTGLGGEITRDKKGNVYANIVDAETGKIEITKYNTKTMKDSNGNSFKIVNGQIQVDVVKMSENAGVGDTVSWWNDNKKSNLVVQPDMKYAPVQVTRAGNDVTIKAFVNFTGDSNEIMPSTEISYITTPGSKTPPSGMTFGEVAAQSIMDTWKGTYEVYGKSVNVSTEIYSNSYSPNSILQPVWASEKQKYLNYEILVGTEHIGEQIGMGSHNDGSTLGIINGLFNAIIPGDYNGENIYNWSIGNSSQHIAVYTHSNNEYIGDNWFKQTAAHEFGHALGLGDAYNAGYRGGSWLGREDGYYAPYKYSVNDDYGSKYDVYVPNNDIMLEGAAQNYVYSNDIRMVLDAYGTGEMQLYPWGSKDFNKR